MTGTSPEAGDHFVNSRESGFAGRHIGPSSSEIRIMLEQIGCDSIDQLLDEALPDSIRSDLPGLQEPLSESEVLERLRELERENGPGKSMIGQGYYNCLMPPPVQRLIFENPSWYTAYTPYQAEISQGRLEMLLNFQTMCAQLSGLPHANASLLDEATAAAEAMLLLRRAHRNDSDNRFLVDEDLFAQTHAVLCTRASWLGIEIVRCRHEQQFVAEGAFGALLGCPGASGAVFDRSELIARLAAKGIRTAMCADVLALCMIKPPGAMGAAVAVGSTQRFGLPPGCGGPHAAYMAFADGLQRLVPGRIVGISRDSRGRPALRLALQTREQHIRRAKATSNICTAQVLPAVLAAAYAIHHGPEGLRKMAERVNRAACALARSLIAAGHRLVADSFFDTIRVCASEHTENAFAAAAAAGYDLHRAADGSIGISCDESTTAADLAVLARAFAAGEAGMSECKASLPDALLRSRKGFMTQPVFSKYRSEHGLMRYLRRLADRDIALDRSMIPLGSCTMKLNAAAQMSVISWPRFAQVHPFAPRLRRGGYERLGRELEEMLAVLTGMDAVSLQPNAGSQGEYAGLLAIRGYLRARGQEHRQICLIPESAHGTNAASAVMSGLQVVGVQVDADGEIDMKHLSSLCAQHRESLAALMITYPSTCGIYGTQITRICQVIHEHGGQVYMDGANLNAMVGVAQPGSFGVDVLHINLHKTFCIPHGGGGPGMGPIACRSHLAEYLPGDPQQEGDNAVSAAPLGSGLILLISWAYIRMMGAAGLRAATGAAILAANYMCSRLGQRWKIAYRGAQGRVAHEFIIDANEFRKSAGITVEDIAKRLIDMGFHAPTVSFPLAGAVMIEPTESESLAELDRFCQAMECIRDEIQEVESGSMPAQDNPLVKAPHPAEDLLAPERQAAYSAQRAAYPLDWIRDWKYFPPVSRIDQVFGDRNLVTVLEEDEEFGRPAAAS